MSTEPNPPSAFISYSHDSEVHREWVRALAERLTRNGVHVVLDQWHLALGDDLPLFMERSVANCDYVLLICTEAYVEKADRRAGGVGFESGLLASLLLTASQIESKGASRLIPVVRQTGPVRRLPRFASSRLYADLSANAAGVEAAYEKLVRTLHGTPKHEPPPLGFNPFAPSAPEAVTPELQQQPPKGWRIPWAVGIPLALTPIILWWTTGSDAFKSEAISADVAKVSPHAGAITEPEAQGVTGSRVSLAEAARIRPVASATNKPIGHPTRMPRTGPADAPRNAEVELKFSADGWAEVYDASGQRLFYDVGPADSVHTVAGMLPIRLILGNAAGVAIEVNGRSTTFADMVRPDGSANFLIDVNGQAAKPGKNSNPSD